MNRKAHYSEARRLTRPFLGVFTPDALREHLRRLGGIEESPPPSPSWMTEVAEAANAKPTPDGAWSSPALDIPAALRKLREISRTAAYAAPIPLFVGLTQAAFAWASQSRYYPRERPYLRVRLREGTYWTGVLTPRGFKPVPDRVRASVSVE